MRFLSSFAACRFAVLLVMMVGLAGCTTVPLPEAPQNVTPVAPLATELAPYRIQIGDVIEIKMLLNPEFDQEIIVRPDGMISTAVVQDVMAYGRTPVELKSDLIAAYKKQLSDPQLSVLVRSFAPTRVYVLGEVVSPGEFISVGPNPTLLQAIARAGGVKNSAKTGHITILRRGSGEKPESYTANYDEAVKGANPGADVRLAAYDVVYVPKTGVAEVYVGYEQLIRQFLPSSFGLSYSLGSAGSGN